MTGELNVGLIGLGGGARAVLDALLAEPRIRLVAIGDHDRQTAQTCAELTGAEPYLDYRSLIVEHQLDALFVAAPHFAVAPYLKLAAGRGLPVWKQTPLARRFEEALLLTKLFEGAAPGGCPLVVARPWPAEPAMAQAGQTLARFGKSFLADSRVYAYRSEDLGWRGDSERAGGGVLLHEAYPAVDAIVHWMGPPAEVYAAASRVSRPHTRYPYDTEDTAAVVLRYNDGAVASLISCWTSGPPSLELTIYSIGGTVRIDRQRVTVFNRAGEPAGTPFDRAPNPYSHPIRVFLDGITGDRKRLASLARDHLWTMAVIETAYLSARTGEPESPAKWFEMLRTDWPSAPAPGAVTERAPEAGVSPATTESVD